MSISGITENEYAKFLENGGFICVTIDKSDIMSESDFETSEEIRPNLFKGFEIPPSNVIVNIPENRATMYQYGEPWDRTVIFVYGHGGKIIYKKIANGKYEAEVTLPQRT
ncbi:MAG: hypothetical protein JJE30_03780 [Desulfuromonadales bacterium]|nr:hypothetical protein [Desulfuromonadales bacterium]